MLEDIVSFHKAVKDAISDGGISVAVSVIRWHPLPLIQCLPETYLIVSLTFLVGYICAQP